jgi:hypothetical protein
MVLVASCVELVARWLAALADGNLNLSPAGFLS